MNARLARPWASLQKIHSRIFQGRLTRAVGTLAAGTVVAQLLSVVTAPILTRLYTPSDYGLAAVLSSAVGIAAILGTCRYEMAINLAADEDEADNILSVSLFLGLMSAVVIGVVTWKWGAWVFSQIGAADLYAYWWMLPAIVLATTLHQSLYSRMLRHKRYADLAKVRLTQSVGGATISIAIGTVTNGPIGLMLGSLGSSSLGIPRMGQGVVTTVLQNGLVRLARRGWKALKQYGKFAAFTATAALLNASGTFLPPVLFAALYNEEVVGVFSLAQRVVLLPMTLIGTAVAQVFLAEVAEMVRERPGEVPAFFNLITRKMAVLSVGVMVVGALCPLVFPVIFGRPWEMAGIFAAMLSVAGSAQLMVSPISNIAILRQRQDWQLVLDLVRFAVVISAIWVPWHYGHSATFAVMSYSLAMTSVYLLSFWIYHSIAVKTAAQ